MTTTIKSNTSGKVTDVTCDQCHKLVPFTQPQLSVDPAEAIVLDHACPPQILADRQDDIAGEVTQSDDNNN